MFLTDKIVQGLRGYLPGDKQGPDFSLEYAEFEQFRSGEFILYCTLFQPNTYWVNNPSLPLGIHIQPVSKFCWFCPYLPISPHLYLHPQWFLPQAQTNQLPKHVHFLRKGHPISSFFFFLSSSALALNFITSYIAPALHPPNHLPYCFQNDSYKIEIWLSHSATQSL